jgi:hypothetical protein
MKNSDSWQFIKCSRRHDSLEAPARIELATLRLGNECSIQLSYGATIHLYKILERDGRIRRMYPFWSFLAHVDWLTISGIFVAVVSLWVAIRALKVSDETLVVARKTLQDADEDWAQRKWFDLYVKADEAFNFLDRFRQVHSPASMNPAQQHQDWNEVMFAIRRAHTMAMVFPKNPAIDKFIAATSVFDDMQHGYNKTYLAAVLDATEDLRDMAKLKPEVLNRPKHLA